VTEEQIKKKIAEIGWIMPFTGEYHAKTSDVIHLIRTVAVEARKEAEARIKELEESNKTLAELALDWLQSSEVARGNIFGSGDRVDYETAKKEISALQGKEK